MSQEEKRGYNLRKYSVIRVMVVLIAWRKEKCIEPPLTPELVTSTADMMVSWGKVSLRLYTFTSVAIIDSTMFHTFA